MTRTRMAKTLPPLVVWKCDDLFGGVIVTHATTEVCRPMRLLLRRALDRNSDIPSRSAITHPCDPLVVCADGRSGHSHRNAQSSSPTELQLSLERNLGLQLQHVRIRNRFECHLTCPKAHAIAVKVARILKEYLGSQQPVHCHTDTR